MPYLSYVTLVGGGGVSLAIGGGPWSTRFCRQIRPHLSKDLSQGGLFSSNGDLVGADMLMVGKGPELGMVGGIVIAENVLVLPEVGV